MIYHILSLFIADFKHISPDSISDALVERFFPGALVFDVKDVAQENTPHPPPVSGPAIRDKTPEIGLKRSKKASSGAKNAVNYHGAVILKQSSQPTKFDAIPTVSWLGGAIDRLAHKSGNKPTTI